MESSLSHCAMGPSHSVGSALAPSSTHSWFPVSRARGGSKILPLKQSNNFGFHQIQYQGLFPDQIFPPFPWAATSRGSSEPQLFSPTLLKIGWRCVENDWANGQERSEGSLAARRQTEGSHISPPRHTPHTLSYLFPNAVCHHWR